jgi:hypothetical protein
MRVKNIAYTTSWQRFSGPGRIEFGERSGQRITVSAATT